MKSLFKSKLRVGALFSMLFLTQCCCCILPVYYQVERENQTVQQVIERFETTLLESPVVISLLDR